MDPLRKADKTEDDCTAEVHPTLLLRRSLVPMCRGRVIDPVAVRWMAILGMAWSQHIRCYQRNATPMGVPSDRLGSVCTTAHYMCRHLRSLICHASGGGTSVTSGTAPLESGECQTPGAALCLKAGGVRGAWMDGWMSGGCGTGRPAPARPRVGDYCSVSRPLWAYCHTAPRPACAQVQHPPTPV